MSEGGGPLINVPDLSKPATVLIEKVSDAIGGACAPWQIKRVARAEAEAAKIKSLANIEITELEQRALVRMIQEQARNQENIESITAQAIPHLRPDTKPEALENDWLAHFFDRCQIVSDREMQSLWARLLAEEANSQHSISRRTVELVSTLDKADAHAFTALCGFTLRFDVFYALVFDFENDIYQRAGVTFKTLKHLDDIGLLSFEPLPGYARKGSRTRFAAAYFDQRVFVQTLTEHDELALGSVLLSRTGRELAPLCGAEPVPGFLEYAKDYWERSNAIVILPAPGQSRS
jgi:hypothetical protein